ncbi:hypothetical protein BVG79_00914 [Ketogulonicigenium robustum]|uniref:Uncharacterized protein n=1 Tax=Ketogulonicigenium robustum TaxID=92947 RepID=A0A1W6NYD2_9RHOB|nr:hypothetical protein BVG79_00914 [Ketogulonicigenium robustum]
MRPAAPNAITLPAAEAFTSGTDTGCFFSPNPNICFPAAVFANEAVFPTND